MASVSCISCVCEVKEKNVDKWIYSRVIKHLLTNSIVIKQRLLAFFSKFYGFSAFRFQPRFDLLFGIR